MVEKKGKKHKQQKTLQYDLVSKQSKSRLTHFASKTNRHLFIVFLINYHQPSLPRETLLNRLPRNRMFSGETLKIEKQKKN